MLSVIFSILSILKIVAISECVGFFIIAQFGKDVEEDTKKIFLKLSQKFLIIFIILLIISAVIGFIFTKLV